MTIKEENLIELPAKKFYIVIEVHEFLFDKPIDEFSYAVHKEVAQAARELREHIQEEYVKHNSAGVWEADKDGA